MVDLSAHRHLDQAHQPIADLPGEERIHWTRAERWISHPAAEAALAAMGEPLTYRQPNRMPCLLVHGRTGKTMIPRKFGRDHPKVIDPRLGVVRTPVVLMKLPPEPAEVGVSSVTYQHGRAPAGGQETRRPSCRPAADRLAGLPHRRPARDASDGGPGTVWAGNRPFA